MKSKKIKVGVIGLGYVGLPLAIRFCEEKFNVIGFDIDKTKVGLLDNGKSFIKHISDEIISSIIDLGFTATSDFQEIVNIDIILIAVFSSPYSHFRLVFQFCVIII